MKKNNLFGKTLLTIGGLAVAAVVGKKMATCRICKSIPCKCNLKNPSVLSEEFIKLLVKNYKENQLKAIEQAVQIEDTTSIWFDLPKLKKLISEIENQAIKTNPSLSAADLGIRFYCAAYPNEKEWKNSKIPELVAMQDKIGDYAKKHTLVLIPTINKKMSDGEVIACDFNPLDRSTYFLSDIVGGKSTPKMKTQAYSLVQSESVMGENHGSLIPPKTRDGATTYDE